MKKIFVFTFLMLLLFSGCKYFKRSSAKTMDTVTADTTANNEIIDSAALYSGINEGNESMAASPSSTSRQGSITSGKYYMIVGCFTVQGNADKYAQKLNDLGYTAQIIPGRDNFQMVAVKSYTSYREGVAELDRFRTNVTPNAWVYRHK
jgi:hypothetical protein